MKFKLLIALLLSAVLLLPNPADAATSGTRTRSSRTTPRTTSPRTTSPSRTPARSAPPRMPASSNPPRRTSSSPSVSIPVRPSSTPKPKASSTPTPTPTFTPTPVPATGTTVIVPNIEIEFENQPPMMAPPIQQSAPIAPIAPTSRQIYPPTPAEPINIDWGWWLKALGYTVGTIGILAIGGALLKAAADRQQRHAEQEASRVTILIVQLGLDLHDQAAVKQYLNRLHHEATGDVDATFSMFTSVLGLLSSRTHIIGHIRVETRSPLGDAADAEMDKLAFDMEAVIQGSSNINGRMTQGLAPEYTPGPYYAMTFHIQTTRNYVVEKLGIDAADDLDVKGVLEIFRELAAINPSSVQTIDLFVAPDLKDGHGMSEEDFIQCYPKLRKVG